jgi:hypothetical protein
MKKWIITALVLPIRAMRQQQAAEPAKSDGGDWMTLFDGLYVRTDSPQ